VAHTESPNQRQFISSFFSSIPSYLPQKKFPLQGSEGGFWTKHRAALWYMNGPFLLAVT
jgi:hypothetical protein